MDIYKKYLITYKHIYCTSMYLFVVQLEEIQIFRQRQHSLCCYSVSTCFRYKVQDLFSGSSRLNSILYLRNTFYEYTCGCCMQRRSISHCRAKRLGVRKEAARWTRRARDERTGRSVSRGAGGHQQNEWTARADRSRRGTDCMVICRDFQYRIKLAPLFLELYSLLWI